MTPQGSKTWGPLRWKTLILGLFPNLPRVGLPGPGCSVLLFRGRCPRLFRYHCRTTNPDSTGLGRERARSQNKLLAKTVGGSARLQLASRRHLWFNFRWQTPHRSISFTCNSDSGSKRQLAGTVLWSLCNRTCILHFKIVGQRSSSSGLVSSQSLRSRRIMKAPKREPLLRTSGPWIMGHKDAWLAV